MVARRLIIFIVLIAFIFGASYLTLRITTTIHNNTCHKLGGHLINNTLRNSGWTCIDNNGHTLKQWGTW